MGCREGGTEGIDGGSSNILIFSKSARSFRVGDRKF